MDGEGQLYAAQLWEIRKVCTYIHPPDDKRKNVVYKQILSIVRCFP